ncbi:hypothetical protein Cgig2_020025 [Carnegiea gigantea]|uniref:Uncharacterized protein n=1 Tax=Carnegiea gigantea TaxID=171969 RepID=A0A9Q1K2H9_9CARY|nr:hypothetical protein Cgig2_020025 [Carnegiea gigantea]
MLMSNGRLMLRKWRQVIRSGQLIRLRLLSARDKRFYKRMLLQRRCTKNITRIGQAKSANPRLEQTHLSLGFHSDAKDTEVEIVTDGELNDEVSRNERPIKVDEDTDFKKLKLQVGMTFRTIEMFKDAISRLRKQAEALSEIREEGGGAKRRKEARRVKELLEVEEEAKNIPSSSGSQPMTEQGQPIILSQASFLVYDVRYERNFIVRNRFLDLMRLVICENKDDKTTFRSLIGQQSASKARWFVKFDI